MSRIIEHFKAIAKIPHCSKQTKALRDFLVNNIFPEGEHLFFTPPVAAKWELVVVEFIAIFRMFIKRKLQSF